jgi:hypothetical protein
MASFASIALVLTVLGSTSRSPTWWPGDGAALDRAATTLRAGRREVLGMVLPQAGRFVVSLAVGLLGRGRSLAQLVELGDMIIDNAGGVQKRRDGK